MNIIRQKGSSFRRLDMLMGTAAVIGSWITPVHAANAQTTSAAESTSSGSDIVVTATRRAENLNDVPIAVTAVGGDDLHQLNLKDAYAIVGQVPNMTVAPGVGSHAVTQFNLRGVGTNDVFVTAVPAVGVYYNDVFVNSVFGQAVPLFDQERVEILRGPQGTLWGKNTTAGAVNIIARAPEQDFNGYARLTYGNYNYMELETAVGGPIVEDRLSARASAFLVTRDGFYKNIVNNERVNNYNDLAFRGQLLWESSEKFKAHLIAMVRRENENNYGGSFGWLPGGFNAVGLKDETRDGRLASDLKAPVSIDTDVISLNMNYNPSDSISITSISGYIFNKFRAVGDPESTPLPLFHIRQDVDAKQYTQELRVASDPAKSFRWLLGAFYLRENLDGLNPGVVPLQPELSTVRIVSQKTDSIAGYVNVEKDFGPVTLRGGLRYTHEAKTVDMTVASYIPGATDVFDINQALSFTPYLTVDGLKRKDSKVTWDFSAQYKIDEDNMIFGRVARGFKSSIVNSGVFNPNDFSIADPETITDYEIGLKTRWLDGALNVNLTGFYYDYRDYQVQLQLPVPAGVAFAYGNADKARVLGAELEVVARPITDLLLRINAGVIDAEFRDFSNASIEAEVNSNLPFDASGQRLLRAPKATGSVFAQYTIRGQSGDLSLQTDWNYVGRTNYALWADVPASEVAVQPDFLPVYDTARRSMAEQSRIIGGARLGYRFGKNRNVELSIWSKNITNKYYRTSVYSFTGTRSGVGFLGDPRTFGATFSFDF